MSEKILTVSVDEQGELHSSLTGSIPNEKVPQLEQEIAEAKALIREAYQRRNIEFRSLIDLTQFEGTYAPKAIAVLAAYMKANKPFVFRSAAFGGGDMTNLAANIVATMAGRDNLAFFKTREQAEEWLAKIDAPVVSGVLPRDTTPTQ
ncbi:MAG: hypothetical protein KBD06_03630 [Candidatus Pacebacteria bacterium]|nr:hypothetical protein [Candidatus Paceibacterota bacterium]